MINQVRLTEMRMAENRGISYASPHRVTVMGLVLLGRRLAGKSSLGNLILGRNEFESGKKTTRCVRRYGWVEGVRLAVVDTPGWSLFGLADATQVKEEILHSVMLCPPGLQMFLSARGTDTLWRNIVYWVMGSGHTLWCFFTWGDELRGRTIEKHTEKKGEPLQGILRKCGYRYHVVNNKCTEDNKQVIELINVLKQMYASISST